LEVVKTNSNNFKRGFWQLY